MELDPKLRRFCKCYWLIALAFAYKVIVLVQSSKGPVGHALGEIAILDYNQIEGSNVSIMHLSFNFLITKILKFICQNKIIRCDIILFFLRAYIKLSLDFGFI